MAKPSVPHVDTILRMVRSCHLHTMLIDDLQVELTADLARYSGYHSSALDDASLGLRKMHVCSLRLLLTEIKLDSSSGT